MADDLYDRDYFAWTQAQAEALRARGAGRNSIDYDNLAEEVGDMGKADLAAVESLVVNVLVHLIKLEFSKRDEPRAHWRAEIVAFRLGWRRRMTPSIRARIVEELDDLHKDAFELAEARFVADEPEALPIDTSRRWTVEEVLA